MRTTTVTRPAQEAPAPDACYAFAVGGERFVGVVRDVLPVGASEAEITVEMTTREHQRLLVADSG
jgi:hypothetical protein